MTTKHCPDCTTLHPTENFHRNKSRADGLQSYCKSCAAKRTRAYISTLPSEERKRRSKASNLRHFFGISPEEFGALVSSQKGLCGICGTALGETTKGPCVDHNHHTGAVRGILCSKCNSALGLFQDDPTIIQAAIHYLNDRGSYAPSGGAAA